MELKQELHNIFIEFCYVKGMDPTRYAKIKENLWNEFLKVQNNHPKIITDAYQLQNIYCRQIKKIQNNKSEVGLYFFNKKYASFYKFGEKGQISPNFPKNNKHDNINNN